MSVMESAAAARTLASGSFHGPGAPASPGWIGAYLIAALPVAFLVAALVGIAIERGVIRFLYGRPLETMLATWGVSLALQQAVRMIFGAPNPNSTQW